MAKGRARTPEFFAEVLAVHEKHGIPGVIKKYGYTESYAHRAVRDAQNGGASPSKNANRVRPRGNEDVDSVELRQATTAVRCYLDACAARAEGERQVSVETLERQLTKTQGKLSASDNSVQKLLLTQKLRKLEKDVAAASGGDCEADFIAVAKWWGELNEIEYGTWRELGVPAAVLTAAGITRSS